MEANQNRPNPALILAMAEDKKGTAALLKEKRESVETSIEAIDRKRKTDIEAFDSQTKRMAVLIDAKEADANVKSKEIDRFGKEIDAAGKILDIGSLRSEVSNQVSV
jgi:hypothetical protein